MQINDQSQYKHHQRQKPVPPTIGIRLQALKFRDINGSTGTIAGIGTGNTGATCAAILSSIMRQHSTDMDLVTNPDAVNPASGLWVFSNQMVIGQLFEAELLPGSGIGSFNVAGKLTTPELEPV